MTIAVLMSTYNGEKFIREQIESILAQKGKFFLNLWVRDDGSTDSTQMILKEYADAGSLYWYTGDNLGVAHSFLDLVRHCRGFDYYAFADQDDYWFSDKIKHGIDAIEKIDAPIPVLYFANAELVGSELESLGRNVYKNELKKDFETLTCAGGYLGCTMVFNEMLAKLIQSNEMPGKIVFHDFYVAMVCAAFDGAIIFDNKSHMKYRQHGGNIVGVSHGIFRTIKSRIYSINTRAKVSIAEQAETLLGIYKNEIGNQKRGWLLKVSSYRNSIISRVLLAISKKTHYMNINMGLKLRISILLGNR